MALAKPVTDFLSACVDRSSGPASPRQLSSRKFKLPPHLQRRTVVEEEATPAREEHDKPAAASADSRARPAAIAFGVAYAGSNVVWGVGGAVVGAIVAGPAGVVAGVLGGFAVGVSLPVHLPTAVAAATVVGMQSSKEENEDVKDEEERPKESTSEDACRKPRKPLAALASFLTGHWRRQLAPPRQELWGTA
eukprot:TRINITY_DN9656_c0_g1_i1.p1 TRINITY_DN9656_c0_g1~~TRINITY_DN9656_c0_g1_i1.p1  ORF type:complete len:192 (+),score=31.65 TRINITY_DN9656_c0_g1_i1:76-651(+)